MEKENEKEFKQTRLTIVLVAIIVVLVFALGFVLGTKNNNLAPNNETKEETKKESEKEPEPEKEPEEETTREFTKEDAKELLTFYNVNPNTVEHYNIYRKLEVTYDYLIEKNKDNYRYDTCENILKSELKNWKKEGDYAYYLDHVEYYYCSTYNNQKHYVIPYKDFEDALNKLYSEKMKKDFSEFYYVKDLDSIVFMPYRDGTEGPSIAINEIKEYKKENNKIEIMLYSEKIPCEDYDYQTDRSKNCGKNGWKESGNYNEIEKNIIEKYSDEVNLYKIKIEDHGDYTTFVSLERQ